MEGTAGSGSSQGMIAKGKIQIPFKLSTHVFLYQSSLAVLLPRSRHWFCHLWQFCLAYVSKKRKKMLPINLLQLKAPVVWLGLLPMSVMLT